jgi:hypothetical protein
MADQTIDIVDHWTVARVGRKPFHLEVIDLGHETAQLHAIIAQENVAQKIIIDYEFPPDFASVMQALAERAPIHMVGFEDGLLADAHSVWGYVCPCQLESAGEDE